MPTLSTGVFLFWNPALTLCHKYEDFDTFTVLVHAGLFCFHNPPNSDMDNMIFNVYSVTILLAHIHGPWGTSISFIVSFDFEGLL